MMFLISGGAQAASREKGEPFMAKKDKIGPLERAVKEFRWSFIISALVFIVLGLLLILQAEWMKDALSYAVGIALTVYGAFNVLSFLFARERSLTFELVIGVITLAVGIFALSAPDIIFDTVQLVLGLVIIIDSLLGIKRAFALRELGLSSWAVMLFLSIATSFLGIMFMLNKGIFGNALMIVIGAVLLYQGISDMITVIRISVVGKRMKKNLKGLTQNEIVIDPEDD